MPTQWKKYSLSWLLLLILINAPVASGVSNQIKLDIAQDKLAEAWSIQDDTMILEAVKCLRELVKIGFIEEDSRLDYLEGQSHYNLGHYIKARPLIESYLNKQGRSGEFYKESIRMIDKLDDLVAKQIDGELKKNRYFFHTKSASDAAAQVSRIEELLKQCQQLGLDSKAQYIRSILGDIYFEGATNRYWNYTIPKLLAPDAKKARYYLEEVDKHSVHYLFSPQKVHLGQMYRYGLGGPVDMQKAIATFQYVIRREKRTDPQKLFKKNMRALREARNALFSIYAFGENGITQDINTANQYAEEQDLSDEILGDLYANGIGRPKNRDKAAQYYSLFSDYQGKGRDHYKGPFEETIAPKVVGYLKLAIEKEKAGLMNYDIIGWYKKPLEAVGFSFSKKKVVPPYGASYEFYFQPNGRLPYRGDALSVIGWKKAKSAVAEAAYHMALQIERATKKSINRKDAAIYYQLAADWGYQEAADKLQAQADAAKALQAHREKMTALAAYRKLPSFVISESLNTLAVNPDKTEIAMGKTLKTKKGYNIIITDIQGNLKKILEPAGKPEKLQYSPDGKWLASVSTHRSGATLELWDTEDGYDDDYDRRLKGDKKSFGDITFLSFLPDGKSLIVGSRRAIEKFSVPKLKEVWKKSPLPYDSNALALSADGSRIVAHYPRASSRIDTYGTEKGNFIWLLSYEQMKKLGESESIAFLGDSHNLVVTGENLAVINDSAQVINVKKQAYSLSDPATDAEKVELHQGIAIDPADRWLIESIKIKRGGIYRAYYDLNTLDLFKIEKGYGSIKGTSDRKWVMNWDEYNLDLLVLDAIGH